MFRINKHHTLSLTWICFSSCTALRYSLGKTLTNAPTSASQSDSRRLASAELVNLTWRWMMLRSVTSSCCGGV